MFHSRDTGTATRKRTQVRIYRMTETAVREARKALKAAEARYQTADKRLREAEDRLEKAQATLKAEVITYLTHLG